jgi:predicted ATP-grasp superfamily ATP-dependent carboligase
MPPRGEGDPATMDALITDLHLRWPIAGLRALGRTGLRLLATAPRRSAPGLWSRYATQRALVPPIPKEPHGFAAEVGRLAARHGPLVVYPGTEEAIATLFRHRAALGSAATLPYPGPEPLDRLRSKRTLPKLAAAAGLRCPVTLFEGRAGESPVADLPYPSVLKPFESGGALGSSVVVAGPRDLRTRLDALPFSAGVLVQEYVRGTFVSLDLVIDREGRLVRRFQHHVLRTAPPEGGSVARSVSVAPDEELAARATDMLVQAGYWGLAGLQFLANESGPALIDVNPRFYGPLPLSLACGVNLPAAWHAVTIGEDPGGPGDYPPGITYHRAEADIGAAVRGNPGVLFERGSRPRAGSFWAADDPVPAALLTAEALGVRTQNRLSAARRRLKR